MSKKRDEYFNQIKELGVLPYRQLLCFKYICMYGPITANEIIDKITHEHGEDDAYQTMSWNKYPSQLLALNIVENGDKKRCKSVLTKSDSLAKTWIPSYRQLVKKNKKLNTRGTSLVEQAVNSALLAVEVYNKPDRVKFKTESYITIMIIAWNKILHAYFLYNGIDYYFKDPKTKKYQRTKDGERKTWGLLKCIKEYANFNEPVISNLELHCNIRNNIVHGDCDDEAFNSAIFPECQALLFNFENFVIKYFGVKYALNQSLSYSLQFSILRNPSKNPRVSLNKKQGKLYKYLIKYRLKLDDKTFNSSNYALRFISMPFSDDNRDSLSLQSIEWENLGVGDDGATHAPKIKVISNKGMLRSGQIIEIVKSKKNSSFNSHLFKCFCYIYSIRPYKGEDKNKYMSRFCAYDEVNNSYIYYPILADVIHEYLKKTTQSISKLRNGFSNNQKLEIKDLLEEQLS